MKYLPYFITINLYSLFLFPNVKLADFLTTKRRHSPTDAISDLSNLKNKKRHFFETGALLLLSGMKAKWDEVGARILLGDNTGGETVMLCLSRFECFEVWISTGLLCTCTYAHGWPHIYPVPNTAIFKLRRTYFLKSMSVCTDEQTNNCTVRRCIPNLSFVNCSKKEIIFNCINFSLYLTENRILHYND